TLKGFFADIPMRASKRDARGRKPRSGVFCGMRAAKRWARPASRGHRCECRLCATRFDPTDERRLTSSTSAKASSLTHLAHVQTAFSQGRTSNPPHAIVTDWVDELQCTPGQ